MISSAPQDQKKGLTKLANKLFCSIEEIRLPRFSIQYECRFWKRLCWCITKSLSYRVLFNTSFPALQLDEAVKIRSITFTHDRYTEAAGILHEVMELMPSD
ncbi:hypothetical protein RHGRI_026420 [Rhododendron griersonianum]|uniref:Uncharacterized protein n=1 Tax=Rhododendron griersonianum TaxID=479676 RepID=A0AAV6IV10_9ERIC|nr:hypothetical protein RHGRI_026420 [Rhododendron griersonianum]